MVESGPASGFWGAAELGRLIGEPNVLALDIGGTTAKCSLDRGRPRQDHDRLLDRARAGALPATRSWCRSSTSSRSATAAAASPGWTTSASSTSARGPPAPSRGPPRTGAAETDATTTDANLALGRINPAYFCGGEVDADMDAVDRALDARRREARRRRAADAARGIVRIANNNMVNALKLVSVNRGYDPRDFTLVAFGGGGGMHAVALAAELGMREGRDPARGGRVQRLGDADERPAPRLLRHPPDDARRPTRAEPSRGLVDEIEDAGARAVRRRGDRGVDGPVRRVRALALREPGAQRRGAAPRRRRRRRRSRRDRRAVPRDLRARVHLPARRAGRARRRARRRDRPRSASSRRQPLPVTGADWRARTRASARSTIELEGVAHGDDLRRRRCSSRGWRSTGPAVVETTGSDGRRAPGRPRARSTSTATSTSTLEGRMSAPAIGTSDPITLEIIQSSLQADQRRDVRRHAPDGDERDHLRGPRHGHRRSPTPTGSWPRAAPASPRSSACSTRRCGGSSSSTRAERDRARATSSPPTIRSTAASRTSTTSCSRCRCSPTASSSPGRRTSRTGTTSAAWCPGSISTDAREIYQEGSAAARRQAGRRGRSRTTSVMRDHGGQLAACPTSCGATCGPASRRSGSARGGCRSSSPSTGTRRSSPRSSTSWTTASRCRSQALRELPKGTLHARGGAGQRRRLPRDGRDHRRRVHRRPARQPRPGRRGRTTPSRDGAMVAAQMVFKALTDPYGARQRRHFRPLQVLTRPGSVFDAQPSPPRSPSTTRSRSGSTT